MKIKVWCDSGANAFSCREEIVDTEECFGLTDEEWNDLTEDEREDLVKDTAWERLDWGYRVI